jgi:tetratricopeptide (TPR) repeat protein
VVLLNDRYQLEETLGQGGAGVVYRAFDRAQQRPVAIKYLATTNSGPDQGAVRMQREAALLSRLAHPNIVGFYGLDQAAGQPFLVLEYIAGCTLRDLLDEVEGALPLATAEHIIRAVLAALAAAHQANIIHRDLKPENIMLVGVNPDSALAAEIMDPPVKVMDFGLAYLSDEVRITGENLVAGTALYLAPEAAQGQVVDGRADLYAVGLILYELVAGRPPFSGHDPLAVISQHLHASPISPRWHNPALPPTLAQLTLKLLAKNPAERYQSADEVLAALAQIDLSAPEAGPPSRASLLESMARSRLVGRQAEVAAIHQAIAGLANGSGRVIFIEGAPGIGKSRLVREGAAYARLQGLPVFTGHCFDADLPLPYQPFVEIIKAYVQSNLSPASTGHLPVRLAAELVKLAPSLEPQLGLAPAEVEGTPAEARLRLFEAVTALLSNGSGPVVLILESFHWASPPDIALLHHLAHGGGGPQPLLLLVTYRGEGHGSPNPRLLELIAHLSRANLATPLHLAALAAEQVTAWLESLLEGEIAPEFSQAIFTTTEGNPFFIEEILKALVEEDRIFRDPGRTRWEGTNLAQLEIPTSLQAVLARRFEQLNPAQRQILSLAGLLGRQFQLETLLAVATDFSEVQVLAALEAAQAMQLVNRVPGDRAEEGYTFSHALLHQALCAGLSARQRARWHGQIGQALLRLNEGQARPPVGPAQLAYHFSLAGGQATQQAISYSLMAIEEALQVYASEVAVKHFQLILDLLPPETDISWRAWLMEQLGDLYFERTRQIVDAVAAYERAIQLWQLAPEPDPLALIRLYRHMGEIARYWPGAVTQLDDYLAEALHLLDQTPGHGESLERARVLATLAFHHNAMATTPAEQAQSLNLAQDAAALAGRLAAANEEAMALDALQRIYRDQGDLSAAHQIDRRRLELIPRLTNPTEAVDAQLGASQMGWESGDLAGATNFCLEGLKLARRTDNVGGQWEALRRLVTLHLQWGKIPAAISYAEQGLALGPRAGLLEFGEPVEALFLAHLALLASLQGRSELAARQSAELRALYPAPDMPPYRFAQGRLHYELEAWDEAALALEGSRPFAFAFWPVPIEQLLLVEVYGHLGDELALNEIGPGLGAALERLNLPYLQAIYQRGYGAYHAGYQEWAEAEAAFNRALAATRRRAFWYQDARTWLAYGRMLAQRNRPGDVAQALEYFSEAQSLFLSFGANALAEKAWLAATRLAGQT